MTRLEKISEIFAQFGGSVFNKFGVSRGLHAEVIIGIVLLLSTVAFSLSMSVMAERSTPAQLVEVDAEPVETPERTLASTLATLAADDTKTTRATGLPVIVTAPNLNVPIGTDINVNILVDDLTNLGIVAWQGDILYDTSVLLPQPQSATINEIGRASCRERVCLAV